MVLNGTLRVLLGLLCLCLRGTEAQGVDQNALARIISYIQTKYSPSKNGQYAVAIYVPVSYCSEGSNPEDGEFLNHDIPDDVKLAMNGIKRVYEGQELIAATRKDAADGKSELHSEYLLLKNPDEDHSPMMNLLNKNKNKKGCVIFYTYNSPCIGTCLHEDGNRHILDVLSEVEVPKAFVYNEIFHYDIGHIDFEEYLKKIDKEIQLYRCYPAPETHARNRETARNHDRDRDRSRSPIRSSSSYECHRCFNSGEVAEQCVN